MIRLRTAGAALAILVLLDLLLWYSGGRILLRSGTSQGWLVEGDLLYPRWDPEIAKHPMRERKTLTDCTFWNGLRLVKISLPSEDLPGGCPRSWFTRGSDVATIDGGGVR